MDALPEQERERLANFCDHEAELERGADGGAYLRIATLLRAGTNSAPISSGLVLSEAERAILRDMASRLDTLRDDQEMEWHSRVEETLFARVLRHVAGNAVDASGDAKT